MLLYTIMRNMSQSNVTKLLKMAETAEERIGDLKMQVASLRKLKTEAKIIELSEENKFLASKIEAAKRDLIKLETLNGKKQYPIPNKIAFVAQEPNIEPITSINKKEKKVKDTTVKSKETPKVVEKLSETVDIRKLDLRIGKIVDISKHPDADSLYVEKIDCGEENPRTVVSGLVNHVPIDEMRDRIVMVLCNLKPAKMRGITSEAMVMCASSPQKVEVLIPPTGAVPGDLVSCEGYPREPEPQLNPKKKIFETCAPDLMTNNDRLACYKGCPLVVPGKGPVVAPTLKGVCVK